MSDRSQLPGSARIMAAIDVTWPPAEMRAEGPWLLRRGAGGGKRVSAASCSGDGAGELAAIAAAEAGMADWGQPALFRLIAADASLDTKLDRLGYRVVDPVALYAAPAAALTGDGPHVALAYRAEFAPAVMEEIWQEGGIGPARRAVMTRVQVPARYLMSRIGDSPSGAAFASVDGDVAMIHAIEVLATFRRRGAARLLIEAAARFAVEAGARWLALAVTEANVPANRLYDGLGMAVAGRYHYRIAERPPTHR